MYIMYTHKRHGRTCGEAMNFDRTCPVNIGNWPTNDIDEFEAFCIYEGKKNVGIPDLILN